MVLPLFWGVNLALFYLFRGGVLCLFCGFSAVFQVIGASASTSLREARPVVSLELVR